MNLGIDGRLALVTGASRGIGAGIAESLAEEGARLVLVARSPEGLEAVRLKLSRPDDHHCVALDLMEEGAPEILADRIDAIGDLDIVVQNLGGTNAVWADSFAPLEEWSVVWRYNVGIAHQLNRLLIPKMVARKWGRVVHLSTVSTRTHKGYPVYVTAKSGLDGYVRSLSREVARDGVVVSAVAPGAIYVEGRHFAKLQQEDPEALERYFDEALPTRRLGTPRDVGPVVAFMCSEQAAFMAGSIVPVDGGGT
jgi:NAD(P)-dependent dehydrogenase (short-subunit alcohol dehydrogenase family)